MEIAALPLAAAAPFVLWPIEILAPYPHVIEEFLKLVLVLIILSGPGSTSKKISFGIAAGVLFALSESFLYFLNIFQVGQPSLLAHRLILTTLLHVATMILMILPALRKKGLVLLGFLLAVILHYYYNLLLINVGPGA